MENFTHSTVVDLIKKIEVDILNIDKCEAISLDTDLVDTGIMDSLTMVELVSKLEDEYKIEIDVDDITPDSFRTINSIYDMCVRSRCK